ncbi:MAG: PIN domain-containing protein [Candidatus Sulfopaludibacter sp.]|nr:PIN domain-containing protein [Candidatus Sulfopaludibacter sp.]
MSASEPGPSFVDTNILVYAFAGNDPKRSPVAQQLLRDLMTQDALRTSTQVLQELFVTLTRKIKPPLTSEQALRYLDRIAVWPVALIDYGAIQAAVDLTTRHSLSFWDGLVVVTAARSGATRLYTEDLTDGQRIMELEVVNPFKGSKRD